MTDLQSINTGYDTTNARLDTSDWDVEAYADSGEFAMCWMLRRVNETTIEQQAVACGAGLRENHGYIEPFDVDSDTSVTEFAHEVANSDPELSIELARNHFTE